MNVRTLSNRHKARKMKSLVIELLLVSLISRCLLLSGRAIESPHYTVVRTESDFQIRLYRESSWMSAVVQGTTSFENSTKRGFHRLYRYIHGANLNSSKMEMTAPVLTSVASSSSHGSSYSVRYFLSANFEGNHPHPDADLNLRTEVWKAHCVAVRKFSGFAKDNNINKEIEALSTSLDKHLADTPVVRGYNNSYTIAQYNASFDLSARLNEVWMNVSGFPADLCKGYKGKL